MKRGAEVAIGQLPACGLACQTPSQRRGDYYSTVRNGLDFDREDLRAVAETFFLAAFLDQGEKR
jgi:hypothetical protein